MNPFAALVPAWLKAIEAAFESKQRRFGAEAEEGQKFYAGTWAFFWDSMKKDRHIRVDDDGSVPFPAPPVNVQVNKVAEFVQLFGPAIYSRNPVRTVTANQPFEPPGDLYAMLGGPAAEGVFLQAQQETVFEKRQAEARALLVQTWLNYTPSATGLREAARKAVTEALVKGAGVLWPQVVQPPGSPRKMTGCVYDTIDNLLIDPDAEDMAQAKWIARRVVKPQWEAEREYGLPPGSLANSSRGETNNSAEQPDAPLTTTTLHTRTGKSGRAVVIWEVYSKMGVGHRLNNADPGLREIGDKFGDFVKLCVCQNMPYFLNLPDQALETPPDPANPLHLDPATGQVNPIAPQQLALAWETPFHQDGGWPFVMIGFHDCPRSPWPLSHLSPAMGELKFLNWAFGHLAAKVRSTSRDFIAVLASAGEEIKSAIQNGGDLTLIEIQESHGKTIDQIVQFLQHPRMNGDIWQVIQAVMELFDKRTGLTELVYGQSGTQMRSGTEARIKGDQMSIRPDDMAECAEAALATAGRMEALVARVHLTDQDVAPVLGAAGASWWQQFVQVADPAEVVFNLQYRVEAGSTKKPNKQRDMDNAMAMMNQLFPPLFQYAQATGQVDQVNALMEQWCKANDIADPQKFLLSMPPPPAPVAGPPPGPGQGEGEGQPNATRAAA